MDTTTGVPEIDGFYINVHENEFTWKTCLTSFFARLRRAFKLVPRVGERRKRGEEKKDGKNEEEVRRRAGREY